MRSVVVTDYVRATQSTLSATVSPDVSATLDSSGSMETACQIFCVTEVKEFAVSIDLLKSVYYQKITKSTYLELSQTA